MLGLNNLKVTESQTNVWTISISFAPHHHESPASIVNIGSISSSFECITGSHESIVNTGSIYSICILYGAVLSIQAVSFVLLLWKDAAKHEFDGVYHEIDKAK